MRRLMLLPLLLSGCMAPPPAPEAESWRPPPASEAAARDRAAELECIRRGEMAERQQPWLGANNPRAAVIGARVRNSCLDSYRRGEGFGGRGFQPY